MNPHPVHAYLAGRVEQIAAQVPASLEIRCLDLPRYGHSSVFVGEPGFRAAFARHTVAATCQRDGSGSILTIVLSDDVAVYCGTREQLHGAVVLDGEGRTVLAPCEGRTA